MERLLWPSWAWRSLRGTPASRAVTACKCLRVWGDMAGEEPRPRRSDLPPPPGIPQPAKSPAPLFLSPRLDKSIFIISAPSPPPPVAGGCGDLHPVTVFSDENNIILSTRRKHGLWEYQNLVAAPHDDWPKRIAINPGSSKIATPRPRRRR